MTSVMVDCPACEGGRSREMTLLCTVYMDGRPAKVEHEPCRMCGGEHVVRPEDAAAWVLKHRVNIVWHSIPIRGYPNARKTEVDGG